uniref:Uncharacterized protein n=2 Tax=Felinae TaxID=338152 RepID=A0ABI7WP85_FELCA
MSDSPGTSFRMTSKDLQEKKIVQEVRTGRATPAMARKGVERKMRKLRQLWAHSS